MKIELLNSKGTFEIWADDQYVSKINRNKGESDSVYAKRADVDFGAYCEKMKAIITKQPVRKVVKSISI